MTISTVLSSSTLSTTITTPPSNPHQPSPSSIKPNYKPDSSFKTNQNSKTIDPTVTWTSLICRHCRNGQIQKAVSLFTQMRLSSIQPNHITFVTLFSGCSHFPSKATALGPPLHGYAKKLGMDTSDVMVGTAIINMYSKFGHLDWARLCFDCLEVKNSVSWNTMIDGYMRNGRIDDAVMLFDEMFDRDVVSWTVVIDGLVKRGCYEDGLEWFRDMLVVGFEPDYVTVVAVLAACANLGALGLGMWMHRYVLEKEFRDNVRVNNSLIDMYSRCGCIELACQVFDTMEERTLVSWNSMIVGFAANGYAEEALEHFELLRKRGLKPDGVSFTGALTACSHSGLVEEGLMYFDIMKRECRISPRIEHYGCVVDIYSRAGRLEEALKVIESMSMKPNEVVIGSLLAACRSQGNIELAEKLMKYLVNWDPKVDSNYVLLANIYAATGEWEGANKIRRWMKALGVQKKPGFSSVEIGCKIHKFVAGDRSHIETEQIYAMLELLSFDLKLCGYVAENNPYGKD